MGRPDLDRATAAAESELVVSIFHHDQIRERVFELYHSGGLPRGDSTGWPSIDPLYSVAMHQWTLITGTPNSGKSEWLDALMVNLAKNGDWKFFIYSPENMPLELHHAKIVEKYIGKPFTPGPTTRLTEDELDEAEEWMRGKFIFCKPDSPTIEAILYEGIEKISSIGRAWKTGIIIDPWNYLEHHRPPTLSETEYVSDVLSRVLACVREWPVHLWLIAHPAKQIRNRDGTYPVPGPRDISGSAHFWNKSDNCITVWRNQEEGNQEVDIHVQKIRFKHIGRIGQATLRYDRVTGRYHEPLKAVDQTRLYVD
jgi:twinkle protein